ncbi:MAG: imidazole glycerol phosphate synthase subunit HisF [Vampirovibrio sp.]|jgi:cyclase|nr:imidazole glycerol phosphate synthase subunit HisF [Vampirovibrio sp.]
MPTTAPNGFCKRIIPCLDVDSHGRTVKGIQFQGLRDIGDPVEMAIAYEAQGADELVFLDISASFEGRKTLVELVKKVAKELRIPFTVGGGISSLPQVLDLLNAGADKVSINSSAVRNPKLIEEIATHCGSQCCVLAIDAKYHGIRNEKPSWDVLVKGGREVTGLDALDWATQAVNLGAGEILLTSWDKDGTGSGFDCHLTSTLSQALNVPVIASGGASGVESFTEVFTQGKADAALAATIFHDGIWQVSTLKHALHKEGIIVRL